jgi:tetratricopeptide (TPR) repeat protein
MMAHILFSIAFQLRINGDLMGARRAYEQSRSFFQESGDGLRVSKDNTDLAGIAIEEGRYAEARKLCEEAIPFYQQLRFSIREEPLWMLGAISIIEGDYAAAKAWYTECLLFDQEIGSNQQVPECLIGFASVASFENRFERAAQLIGRADAEVAERQVPLESFDQSELQRLKTLLCAKFGVLQFEMLAAKGGAMSQEQAIAFALEESGK